jgi:S-layer protein
MALQGFVESEYLAAKLAALQADSATATDWAAKTTTDLKTFLDKAGFTPESHYQAYGWAEGLAPNALFNAAEYKLAKATDMFNKGFEADATTVYTTVADALDAFEAAWPYDPYLHYVQYGSAEKINPSNDFDESAYLASKLADLKADPDTATEWADKTVDDVKDAFAANGLSALGHYQMFGEEEGLAVTEVPADEKVADDGGVEVPGETFTLTVGTDTLDGTGDDDTFVAGVTLAPGTATEVNTLNDADTLDGKAGTDILKATLTGTAPYVVAPTLSNIENVETRFLTTGGTLNLANATGVEKISVVNTGVFASTINNIGAVDNFVVSNHTGANADTVTFDAGTATKLNATFNKVGVVSATAAKEINVNFDDNVFTEATIDITDSNVNLQSTTAGDNDVKTMTVAATGSNELKLTSGAGSLETLTVSGTGSLDVSETATTALKTLTSTAEGGVEVDATAGVLKTVTASAGDNEITTVASKLATATFGDGDDTLILVTDALGAAAKVDLGAGDDIVVLAAASTKGALVDGGDGQDKLAATTAAWINADAKATYTNFEILEIGAANTQSFDLDNLSGIDEIAVSASLVGTNDVKNLASGTEITIETLTPGTNLTQGGLLTAAFKSPTTDKALTVNLNAVDTVVANGAANGTVAAMLDTNTANAIETVTVNSNVTNADAALKAGVNYVNTLKFTTSAGLKELVVKGDSALTITGATDVPTDLGDLVKVNASDSTGNITFDFSTATKAITYIGSDGVDTVNTGTIGDTVFGGLGADAITITTAGVTDTIVYNNVAAESQLTDANKDSKITLAADNATVDSITAFTVAKDKLELDHFAFNDYQKGAVLDLAGEITTATDLTSIEDLFADVNGDRGVAKFYDGTDTYVFIDVDKDGDFSAADDMVIQLAGNIDIAHTDVSFS